jgi:hypothetical protein
VAHAQQPKVPTIGVLVIGNISPKEFWRELVMALPTPRAACGKMRSGIVAILRVVRQVPLQRLNQSACRNYDRFHDAFACNHQEVSYAKMTQRQS